MEMKLSEIDEEYAQLCHKFKSKKSEADWSTDPKELCDVFEGENRGEKPRNTRFLGASYFCDTFGTQDWAIEQFGIFLIFEHLGDGYFNFRYHGDKQQFHTMLQMCKFRITEDIDEEPAEPNIENLMAGIKEPLTIKNKVPVFKEGTFRPPTDELWISIMLGMHKRTKCKDCRSRICRCGRFFPPKYYDNIPKRDEWQIEDVIEEYEAIVELANKGIFEPKTDDGKPETNEAADEEGDPELEFQEMVEYCRLQNRLRKARMNDALIKIGRPDLVKGNPLASSKQGTNKGQASKLNKVSGLRSAIQKFGIKAEVTEAPVEKPADTTETNLQTRGQPSKAKKSKHQGKAKTFTRKTKRSGRV